VVARRDLSSLSREKTIVLALLIQLFVAAFSSFLVVGLTSLYDPGSVDAGGVEIGVTGEAMADLEAAMVTQESVNTQTFEDPERAEAAFRSGQVDALLNGSYTAGPSGGNRIQVTATVPDGSIRTTLIVVQVRDVLKSLERQERFERAGSLNPDPLPLPEEVPASQYFGFTYVVLIPLLLFLPPFISGSVAVDSVTEEIERGTLELLRVAPVSLLDIIDGKSLAMVALAPAQAGLWILLLTLNGTAVANPLWLLVLVTAIAALVVVLGVNLGLRLRRRRPAQLLYSVLTLVVFGAAVALPEHPATTAAKLAIDSPTLGTHLHVVGYVALAIATYLLTRRLVGRVEPESL
jgi:ABC-type Na+ efflux pump permease subunit